MTEHSSLGGNIRYSELLHVTEMVAQEKNIDREIVFLTLEEAISRAARTKYGSENDIVVKIDRKTCEVTVCRRRFIVDTIEEPSKEIALEEAQKLDPMNALGGEVLEVLPPIDFGRITAIGAKQVIVQRMREVEQAKQYDEYKDRIGEIVSGVIKRVEFGNVVVDLNNAEGHVRRESLIPRELLKRGDRIRCYIEEVRNDTRGHQILLSRIHPQFMVKLFTQEVPEIYEGTVEIRACVRDPGSRAKMSVFTSDPSLDPIGACIGMRGSRVQAVTQELQGERVDILRWSEDPATYVVNALSPVEINKVILDQEALRITVVVSEDKLSKAIGRRGQNVRLASELTGYHIDVITDEKEAENRQQDEKRSIDLFMQSLDVDEVLARLLVTEGISGVQELAESTEESLSNLDGLSSELAGEIVLRAKNWIDQESISITNRLAEMGMDTSLEGFCGLTQPMLLALGEIGVRNMDDLAGLAVDEIVADDNGGPLGKLGISRDDAGGLILEARHTCGWITLESDEKKADVESADVDNDAAAEVTQEGDIEASSPVDNTEDDHPKSAPLDQDPENNEASS